MINLFSFLKFVFVFFIIMKTFQIRFFECKIIINQEFLKKKSIKETMSDEE